MVMRLLDLIEGASTRSWFIGQTRKQAALDLVQIVLRLLLLAMCTGCW